MIGRLRTLGIVLAVFSLVFMAAGAFTLYKVNEGRNSLQTFSAAQNVKLAYDEQGNFTSGATAEEGTAILSFLKDEWGYNVVPWEMDKNDPLVNTASPDSRCSCTASVRSMRPSSTDVSPTEPSSANSLAS